MATDQEIRDAGYYGIPKQEYLLNPFEIPTAPEEPVTDSGIVNTNAFMNSGGGSGFLAPGNLMTNFNSAIDARQNRLQNPNKFSEYLAKFGIGGQRSVDQMIRDATAYNMAQLGAGVNTQIIPRNNTMTGPEIRQAIKEYGADETSVGNYPVDNPLDVRKNLPFGLTSILSRVLPSSYYDKMTMPEQIYTQSKMGYTGPTVFGENTSGLQKDIFGRNVISGFGNYAEKQAKDIQKLDDLFASETFTDKYGNLKLEEDDEGIFGFTGGTAKQREDAAKMHKLNLIRYNYDKKSLKELEDIKDQTGFTDIMEAENPGITDYGITSGVSDADYTGGEGPGSLDRAIDRARERSDATTPDDFGQSEGMVDGWED
jgi:hypothetical protein